MKSVKIFNEAGLTDDILEKKHIYSAMKTFKREAKSPEGLRESKGKSPGQAVKRVWQRFPRPEL